VNASGIDLSIGVESHKQSDNALATPASIRSELSKGQFNRSPLRLGIVSTGRRAQQRNFHCNQLFQTKPDREQEVLRRVSSAEAVDMEQS
jgi:hypothetical protein